MAVFSLRRQTGYILLLGAVLLFILRSFSINNASLKQYTDYSSISLPFSLLGKRPAPTLSLTESISPLYAPLRHPINATTYVDVTGSKFEVEVNPIIWNAPLGKDICIVDIDTRNPLSDNQVINPKNFDWERLGEDGLVSQAVVDHYLYAQIHGYDYKFYHAQKTPDRWDTWAKVSAIAELLRSNPYRFVIFLDADAVVHHMEVPMEWLFNRWNITTNTSIALPVDVEREDCLTCDTKGKVMLNSGFIVAQQLNRTLEILDAWASCINDERYEGCSNWKWKWAHEQRAFSEYIRYDFDRPEDIREISCFDANGYPEKPDYVQTNCNGDFIRHYWVNKDIAKNAISNSVMQSIVQRLQRQLLEQKDKIVVNKTDVPKV